MTTSTNLILQEPNSFDITMDPSSVKETGQIIKSDRLQPGQAPIPQVTNTVQNIKQLSSNQVNLTNMAANDNNSEEEDDVNNTLLPNDIDFNDPNYEPDSVVKEFLPEIYGNQHTNSKNNNTNPSTDPNTKNNDIKITPKDPKPNSCCIIL